MTPVQEQKLSKYLKFQEYLSRFPGALEQYPHLKPFYKLFNQRLVLILKTKQMLDECVQNKSLRDSLIQNTVSFSRKIISFALLEDITELQGLGFSPHELMVGADQDLVKTAELLLSKSEDFQNDLIDYGIDDHSIAEFRDQVDKFKNLVYSHEISNDLVNQTFEEFSNLFKETDEIFEGKLEPIILERSPKQ
jgi:hypothetical protein